MAIDPKLRMKIEAELRMGKRPRELADRYDVSYPTVMGWKRKLDEGLSDEDVDELLKYDEVTLHQVVDAVKESAPVLEAKKVEKLVDDVSGLKRLEEKTRELSLEILNKVEVALSLEGEPNMKTLREAAGIVSTLHTALFSKNTTQVLVNNTTNISSEKREIFKSSLKA